MQASQRPPNRKCHERNGNRSGDFAAHRPAQFLRPLGHIDDQPDYVIRDRSNGQAFHGGLQFKLQALPVVHRGQQRLAALLLLDLYPRTQ